ncbi:MAG: hypothetical protein JO262_13270 [Solirubrobacterales bacterium]|nr:hypothetical protein [Solirubrobacterales bacterium]MBV9943093.1 hypothetical protein [Solirubrobacterales bacterium]
MRILVLPGRRMIPLVLVAVAALVALALGVDAASTSAQPNGTCSYTEKEDVPATMRDGTVLRATCLRQTPPEAIR